VIECCRELELSDIKALESLPRLKHLDIRSCKMTDEAVSKLSRWRRLKHLGISWGYGVNNVIRAIGMKLSSLFLEVWDVWKIGEYDCGDGVES
jgi:hypothetical protein